MSEEEKPIYELIGGAKTLWKMVDIFYTKLADDAQLSQMFPDDLEPGKRWQFLFLSQFFGGPNTYMQERGHPRLRMRHAPFRIDQQARDLWLQYMIEAMDEVGIGEPAYSEMRRYFERASHHMINAYLPD